MQIIDLKEKLAKLAHRKILFTPHAVKQMNDQERLITTREVREVVYSGEIIEDYPDDKRGHNCLINAALLDRNIHVVCSPKADYLAIITAYIPNDEKWYDNYTKRIE